MLKTNLVAIVFFVLSAYAQGDYLLCDKEGKTIEAGEYVYIANTIGLDGFSLDFNKKLFSDGGIIKDEGTRILIGKLREDVTSGTLDTVIFNTEEGMHYLELTVTPLFSEMTVEKKTSPDEQLISGQIFFESRGKRTLEGIDSIKLLLNSMSGNDSEEFLVYSSGEEEIKMQFADFEMKQFKKEGEFALSAVYFTMSLSDTANFVAGFSTREKNEYPQNLLIIDSRSRVITENLFDEYYGNTFETIKTFYEPLAPDFVKLQDKGIIVIVNVDGGYMFEDMDIFSNLREISKEHPLFVFTRGLCSYISKDENRSAREYIEMLFDINCSDYNIVERAETHGIQSMDDMEAEEVEESGGGKASFVRKGNVYLFLYLPEDMNIELLKSFHENIKHKEKQKHHKNLSSVIEFEGEGIGEYSLSVYDISGRFFFSNILQDINYQKKSFDMREILINENVKETGMYLYTVKKDDKCIKSGKFFYVYY